MFSYAAIMLVIATNATAVIPTYIHHVCVFGDTIELMVMPGYSCISFDINDRFAHIDDNWLSRDSLLFCS